MHMRNTIVMLLDESDRGSVVAGDEVAKIHVCSVELCEGKSLLPVFGRCRRVTVITDHELVLVGKPPEAFEVFVPG